VTESLGGRLISDGVFPEVPPKASVKTAGSAAGTVLDRTVPSWLLVAALLVVMATQQLLLWRFLGLGSFWLYIGGAGIIAVLGATIRRIEGLTTSGPTLRCLALCAGVALLLFLLGGQGGFFYASPDWMVRDAVLRDMIIYPWPYVYTDRGTQELLRAPIAMYLLPALAGKVTGIQTGNIALLAQNSTMLAVVFALGSTLFAQSRERVIALVVFLFFSGMDVLGKQLNPRDDLYLEQWAGVQFSSHVTQAFWVPHHALAGWIGALLYLLWKEKQLNAITFLTAAPLLALWSPLSLIGLMPFAAHAAFSGIVRKQIGLTEAVLPLVATILSIPSLIYLLADGGEVGARFYALPWLRYVLFQALEAVPFLLIAYFLSARNRFGGFTLAIVATILLASPFGQIGYSVDLPMRASIPALAILSMMIADILVQPAQRFRHRAGRLFIIAILAIGAVTPLSEIRRTFLYPPSPPPLCNVFGAAMMGFGPIGVPIYMARVTELAAWLRPANPAILPANNPSRCWERPWPWPPPGKASLSRYGLIPDKYPAHPKSAHNRRGRCSLRRRTHRRSDSGPDHSACPRPATRLHRGRHS
jgi:hypothetical protein